LKYLIKEVFTKEYLLISLILLPYFSISQDGKFNFGARNSALAGASVTISDPYSLFNNVAGLGSVEHHHIFGGYQNRFGISEFQVIAAGAVYSTNFGSAGLGFYKFGDDLFSQQRIHVALAHKLQMVSLGVGIDILQYRVSTVGSRQVLTIQFGGTAELTPQLVLGAHIFNLNQANLIEETKEKIPTVMKVGISYRPTSEVMVNCEIEKDLGFDEVLKIGIEYQLVKNVYLRTGVSTQPFLSAFGIGFKPNKMQLDYSYSRDSNLGSIHEISLTRSFRK
jgi:hypothetical protein